MQFIQPIMDKSVPWAAEALAVSPEEYEKSLEELEEFFLNASLSRNFEIKIAKVHIPSVGTVTKFEARVVGRFHMDGDLILTTADGLAVNVSALVAQVRRFYEDNA